MDCEPKGDRLESASHRKLAALTFPSVVHDWMNKSVGTAVCRESIRLRLSGHICMFNAEFLS